MKNADKNRIGFWKHVLFFACPMALFLVFPAAANGAGASLSFSPNSGSFSIGATFDVSIFVNTGGESINTVEANIKFDPKKIQVANSAAGKSFISIWAAQPSYSNAEGFIKFQGGVPSPGINTSSGLISTVTFRAVAPGKASIEFLSSSKVLLNDGMGTDILTSKSKALYNIILPPPEGPKVFSSSHSDQNKWSQNNNLSIEWEKEDNVHEFSYILDRNPYSTPDNIPEGGETSVFYENLENGAWYFHIKAKRGDSWGGTTHYLFQIDYTPPAIFEISADTVFKKTNITNSEPVISFFTTDAFSGLSHYQIKIAGLSRAGEENTGFFMEASSPYKISKLDPGEYEIIVRAFDNAGNWRDSSLKIEVADPQKVFSSMSKGVSIFNLLIPWPFIAILILLLIVFVIILILIYRRLCKKLEEKSEKLNGLLQKAKEERNVLEKKFEEKNKEKNQSYD